MKKKFILFIFLICMLLPCSLLLTACGSNSPKTHTHDWSTTWTTNNLEHWYQCRTCDEKKDKSNHDYSEGICVDCQKLQTQGLVYTLYNNEYSVLGIGSCTDTEIFIPSIYNGLAVTSINHSAFKNCNTIISVSIPDSIQAIGYSAFEDCLMLKNVIIGDGVKDIEHSTFKSCFVLENIVLGSSIKNISIDAFTGCTSIRNIEFPNSLERIDERAFKGCSKLESVTIPDNVNYIGFRAFFECSKLEELTIGVSVKIIGKSAFYGCNKLEKAIFKDCDSWNSSLDLFDGIKTPIPRQELSNINSAASFLSSNYSQYLIKDSE